MPGRMVSYSPMRILMALLLALPLAAQKPQFSADEMLHDISTLASDRFEGRAPGSEGEKLTVNFLLERFQSLGLKPGNPDGTYLQRVPMVGITAKPAKELTLISGDKKLALKFGDDYVAFTNRVAPRSEADAEMVFVGYGVVAPEYGWDDYKGLDVRGKVLVMLVNDPPVPDPKDPSKLDPKMFGGKAMTYYGRWTYKYEIAAQKGAAGCLVVHETGPAGYPWSVVRGSWGKERFTLAGEDNNMGRIPIEGWITSETAGRVFDLETLKKKAMSKDFRPVPLGWRAQIALENQIRRIGSQNVIARLDGSDPKLRNQYVIYTAHWDHLGIGVPVNGDKIYNGALDNASGTAALLQLAKACARYPQRPKRSVLFLAVTAEEQGLLGSEYYATHPLYPLARTAAEINMDGMNVHGRTKDVTVVGLGMSTLDDELKRAAAGEGRRVEADPEPEKGFYYRSDHFSFAKQGVPALDTDSGVDYVSRPPGWGLQMREKYTNEDYHKPSDEVKPDWDLSGAVDDLELLFTVGWRVANSPKMPAWRPGTEFKAKRDAMMKR